MGRSLEFRRSTAAVPEVKDFNHVPSFMHAVVNLVRGVVEPARLAVPGHRRSDVRERLQDLHMIDQGLAQTASGVGIVA